MAPELRPPAEEDVERCWRLTQEGMDSYREFAGPHWTPPPETADDLRARLTGSWSVVAAEGEAIVGFGAFEPARVQPRRGPLLPGIAHVWAVFVTRSHWGDGTAGAVLRALTAEMRARGFAHARLYTPAAHARARRFYMREGWVEHGAPTWVPALALELVELRRPL